MHIRVAAIQVNNKMIKINTFNKTLLKLKPLVDINEEGDILKVEGFIGDFLNLILTKINIR